MSETVKINLARLGAIVGIGAGLAGLFGAFVLLPYRMDAAERQITSLQSQLAAQQQMLARIDERVRFVWERERNR